MPPRKRQHYVPQFYMRGFSTDERVPSYQLDRREEFPPTPIRNLCYENYFYDEDGETEETLGELEGEFARVLRKVCEAESISVLEDGPELNLFLVFITYTHSRTKAAKKESNEFATDLLTLMLEVEVAGEGDEEMRENALQALRDGDARIAESPVFPQQEVSALLGQILIADLEAVLLKDVTGREFIFADHPVVLDNPRFKHVLDIGTIGWQTRGLQVFCPLSSELALLLYDPYAYALPDGVGEVIEVGSDIVEELNKLQLVHALDAVFYETRGRGAELRILHEEVEDQRIDEHSIVEQFDGDDERFPTNNEVVQFTRPAPEFSPTLPFIDDLECGFAITRSPQLAELHESLVDDALSRARQQYEAETDEG